MIVQRPGTLEEGTFGLGVVDVDPFLGIIADALCPDDLTGGRVQLQAVVDVIGLLDRFWRRSSRVCPVGQVGGSVRKRNWYLSYSKFAVNTLSTYASRPIDAQRMVGRRCRWSRPRAPASEPTIIAPADTIAEIRPDFDTASNQPP